MTSSPERDQPCCDPPIAVALPRWLEQHVTDLVSQVRDSGGFTVDPRTGESPASGFAVNAGRGAVVVPAERFFAPEGVEVIVDCFRRRPCLLGTPPGSLVGAWHDSRTARVVLSCVDQVHDPHRAMALGTARNQTHIYDLAERRLIATGVIRATGA